MYGKLPMPVLMLAPEAGRYSEWLLCYYITSFKSQLFSPYDSIPAVSCLQSAGCHPLSGLFFSCLQKDDIPEIHAHRSAGKGCPVCSLRDVILCRGLSSRDFKRMTSLKCVQIEVQAKDVLFAICGMSSFVGTSLLVTSKG